MGRHGSFTAAATELFVTQSAVSKQMRQLEDSLGVPLFERKPRGVSLTSAGDELMMTVNVLLTTLYQSVTRIRNVHQSNAVSVLATHALAQFWLFPKLIEFNKAYPDIAVHVHAMNEFEAASLNDFDVGILYGSGEWSTLDSDFLLPEIVYAVAHPALPVASVKTLAQLAQANLVQIDTAAWQCMDWHQWFGHLGIDYSPQDKAPVFNQLTLAFRAVQQGMGIGLAWSFMADEALAKGELQRVTAFECVTGNGEYLVSVKHRKRSACAEVFREWLLESMVG
ncbi:LysR family transcriptional regulator [Pseudomonas sp. M47T1]|uniref:LysR substrate-binding domain-containing protein n=1 Tax=unclassified Pseudomonas TaxID=196821 RepID=UPI0002607B40|nr:LysR substrate-binding domain-containing protein [Pseudomonas sp. M47T1]EIK96237.1 LysR family transcriptional regulator [Pseudomonas sp. M47T1]